MKENGQRRVASCGCCGVRARRGGKRAAWPKKEGDLETYSDGKHAQIERSYIRMRALQLVHGCIRQKEEVELFAYRGKKFVVTNFCRRRAVLRAVFFSLWLFYIVNVFDYLAPRQVSRLGCRADTCCIDFCVVFNSHELQPLPRRSSLFCPTTRGIGRGYRSARRYRLTHGPSRQGVQGTFWVLRVFRGRVAFYVVSTHAMKYRKTVPPEGTLRKPEAC